LSLTSLIRWLFFLHFIGAYGGIPVAEKAKTAQKLDTLRMKRFCPTCGAGAEMKVIQFAGYGQKGFFWVCDKNSDHTVATR
jgi:hypothetical protein